MKSDAFKKDLYRYFGEKGEGWHRLTRSKRLKYIYCFRRYNETKSRIFKLWYRIRLKLLGSTQIQIPLNTKIGEGLYIGHDGFVVINADAVIGKNVNILQGVTIGQENRGPRKGAPTIGSKVVICPGAVIVGKITIGDDVIIAPNSYVNFDVPSHSVVVGNPGVIHHKEEATKGYIGNLV